MLDKSKLYDLLYTKAEELLKRYNPRFDKLQFSIACGFED